MAGDSDSDGAARFDPADPEQTVPGAAKRRRCASCDDRLDPDSGWVIQRTRMPEQIVCTACAEEILDLPV